MSDFVIIPAILNARRRAAKTSNIVFAVELQMVNNVWEFTMCEQKNTELLEYAAQVKF